MLSSKCESEVQNLQEKQSLFAIIPPYFYLKLNLRTQNNFQLITEQ